MPASSCGTKVLIVVDRGNVQAIATMMLTRLGCSVVSVATAEAAIKVLDCEHASIEAVFADIHLPGKLAGYDREADHRALAGDPYRHDLRLRGHRGHPQRGTPEGTTVIGKFL